MLVPAQASRHRWRSFFPSVHVDVVLRKHIYQSCQYFFVSSICWPRYSIRQSSSEDLWRGRRKVGVSSRLLQTLSVSVKSVSLKVFRLERLAELVVSSISTNVTTLCVKLVGIVWTFWYTHALPSIPSSHKFRPRIIWLFIYFVFIRYVSWHFIELYFLNFCDWEVTVTELAVGETTSDIRQEHVYYWTFLLRNFFCCDIRNQWFLC